MIAVFAALEVEVRAAIGWAPGAERRDVGGFQAFEGAGFVVSQCGMGRRSRAGVTAVLAELTPSAVVSLGIAGGLNPEMDIGDVVFCEYVDHESHRMPFREETVYSNHHLTEAGLAAAHGMGLKAASGSSITVDTPAFTPDEKSAHFGWKNHDIVEMESYWIGKAAEAAGVPFVAFRTISDAANHSVAQINAVRDDGTLDVERLATWARENPEGASAFANQSEWTRTAITNLSILSAAFLPPLARHFETGGE